MELGQKMYKMRLEQVIPHGITCLSHIKCTEGLPLKGSYSPKEDSENHSEGLQIVEESKPPLPEDNMVYIEDHWQTTVVVTTIQRTGKFIEDFWEKKKISLVFTNLKSANSFCVCICLYALIYVYLGICVSAYCVGQRSISGAIPQVTSALIFKDRVSHWDLAPVDKARFSGQGAPWIYMPVSVSPSTRVTSACHHTWILIWILGKHFTESTMSPVQNSLLNTE